MSLKITIIKIPVNERIVDKVNERIVDKSPGCNRGTGKTNRKIQVGKDQEKAQSGKRFPLQRWEKT